VVVRRAGLEASDSGISAGPEEREAVERDDDD
jgi:hypothetical protein